MSERMSSERPDGESTDRVFIGIDPVNGEIAEYIQGPPCAEIDANEFLEAKGDPAIMKLIEDAESEGRFWERQLES